MRGLLQGLTAAGALFLCSCGDSDAGTGSSEAKGKSSAIEEAAQIERIAAIDCYPATRIGRDAPDPSRALFVFVDQTTGLDERLRETIGENVGRLVGPGTEYTVATFSASGRVHYPKVVQRGRIEAEIPEEERPELPVHRLTNLDQCLEAQREARRHQLLKAVDGASEASASSFTHSQIMGGLAHLSEAVRQSTADEKLVIVASDLLEHSGTVSFYHDRSLRLIDPEQELRQAETRDLFADFGGARLAVVGAGLVAPESGGETVRDEAKLDALRSFWRQWFERSDAELAAYGEPDLAVPLGWGQTSGEIDSR